MARLPSNLVRRGKRYYFRAQIGGRDVRISLGEHFEDAKRRLPGLRRQVSQAEMASPVNEGQELRIGVFAERWLTEYVDQRRNPAGRLLARQRCLKYWGAAWGNRFIPELTTTDVRKFRSELEGEALSPQTVRHVLSDVRCMFRFAVEVGLIPESPFRLSVMPGVPENAPRSLTEGELTQILLESPAAVRPTVELAILTGLRWGELRQLRWRHVVWQPQPHLVLERTKTGKVRRVPLIPAAKQLLEALGSGHPDSYVLPWRPLHSSQFTKRVQAKTGIRC